MIPGEKAASVQAPWPRWALTTSGWATRQEDGGKILRGEAEPSTMPIEGQTQYRVVVNKAAAEKLNVTLPASLLERADEVIE